MHCTFYEYYWTDCIKEMSLLFLKKNWRCLHKCWGGEPAEGDRQHEGEPYRGIPPGHPDPDRRVGEGGDKEEAQHQAEGRQQVLETEEVFVVVLVVLVWNWR